MSEPQTPTPPPSPPPPPAAPSGGESSNRGIMVVLAYLWILALVPLLAEKDDKEVQWHAKHGLVLLVAEIIVWIVLTILTQIPFMAFLTCLVGPLLWVVFLVLHVICIIKAVNGERFMIPVLSQYADKF